MENDEIPIRNLRVRFGYSGTGSYILNFSTEYDWGTVPPDRVEIRDFIFLTHGGIRDTSEKIQIIKKMGRVRGCQGDLLYFVINFKTQNQF